jgi:tetratricopeptide (TPR) repeat protein
MPAGNNGETAATPLHQALALHQQGRYRDAGRLLAAALQRQPRNPALWHLAGVTAKALGEFDPAEQYWRRALQLAPAFAAAHYDLGLLLQQRNRLDPAIAAYRLALQHDPQMVPALNNLGSALAKQGRLEEAVQCYRQAVALKPDHAKAYHNLGRALGEVGRFEEAWAALRQGMALVPPQQRARYYRTLSFLKQFQPGEAELAEMEALAQDLAALPAEDRVHLQFALGKVYADLGERQRSFGQLLAGNRGKRALTPYDEAATLERLRRIASIYTPQLLAAGQGQGHRSDLPVFIIGMPRSGSTLVEQILASHPQIHGAGECEEFKWLAEAAGFPETVPPLQPLGQAYCERLRARAPQAARIVDKTLDHFLHAGLIHLALPGAKIIHTRRDPVDTCLSCFSQLFNGYHPYAYDLAELGRYWLAYDGLMAHWRQLLPPGVMLELRYEDLVEDLEGQSRRLLAHCGLEWSADCLDFHRSSRPVHTASITQVRQPVYRSSVRKWQAYGELLRPLLDVLEKGGASYCP